MLRHLLAAATVALCAATHLPAQTVRVYTTSTSDALLRVVDIPSAVTLSTTPITAAGLQVNGCNGMARNPLTGELWVLLRVSGTTSRPLGRLDPVTGVVTVVGGTGDNFVGLTFSPQGTLYGVTGDGSMVPETLYTLSLVDGTATLLLPLGNGNNGEAIAFNRNDGLIYHASGAGTQNVTEIFETIDPVTLAVTSVPLSGDDYNQGRELGYLGNGVFVVGDQNRNLYLLSVNGVVTSLGTTLDHSVKGIVHLNCLEGSREDFVLTSTVNGGGVPINCAKPARAGDTVVISASSPGSRFNGAFLLFLGQFFSPGRPPRSPSPILRLDPAGGARLVDIEPSLLPGGAMRVGVVPPGVAGAAFRLQVLAVSSRANNQVYATSNAFDLFLL